MVSYNCECVSLPHAFFKSGHQRRRTRLGPVGALSVAGQIAAGQDQTFSRAYSSRVKVWSSVAFPATGRSRLGFSTFMTGARISSTASNLAGTDHDWRAHAPRPSSRDAGRLGGCGRAQPW